MRDRTELTGVVRGLHNPADVYAGMQQQPVGSTLLTFQLDPVDDGLPVSVEIRSVRMSGLLTEGDVVSMLGTLGEDGVFRARWLVSEDGVEIDGRPSRVRRAATTAALVVAVLGFLVLPLLIWRTTG